MLRSSQLWRRDWPVNYVSTVHSLYPTLRLFLRSTTCANWQGVLALKNGILWPQVVVKNAVTRATKADWPLLNICAAMIICVQYLKMTNFW